MPSRPRPSSAGTGPNANATPLGASSSSRFPDAHSRRTSGGGAGAGSRGGFQTLPGHIANQRKNAYRGKGGKLVIAGGGGGTGKGAYLGKAQKIKESLIARAKLKKSYSKVLKQEGMQSERLGTANRLPDAERDAGSRDKMSEKKRGKQRAAEVVEGDGDGSGSDEDDFGAQASEDEDDSMDGSDGDDVTDGRERQGRTDRGHDRSSKTAASSRAASRDGPAPPLSSSRPSWKDRTVAAAATAASETPNRQSQAGDRALPSLREMKREAYLGPKPKARKQEGEQTAKETTGKNFASTRGDKRLGGGGGSSFPPSGGVGRSRGARFPHSGGGGPRGGGKKRDNRPRMGARIGVMLEEIKRSKGIA